jgi:drug/metabolite transporter (DMT)-like permease
MISRSPHGLAVATVLIWSFGAASAKLISSHSGFSLFALSMLVTYVAFQLSHRIGSGTWISISPRELFSKLGFASLFGYGVYWLCYAQSFRSSNETVLPATLNYTWPLFTTLFTEAFFRTRRTSPLNRLVSIVGLLIGLLGVLIVISKGNVQSLGDVPWSTVAWGIGAGASYGFFGAFSSSVPSGKQLYFLTLASLSGFLFLAPLATYEILHAPLPSFQIVLVTIALSLLMEGLGYYTWTRANRLAQVQQLNPAAIASIMYVLPFLSALIISVLYSDASGLTLSLAVGLVLIVLSSALCQHADFLSARLMGAKTSVPAAKTTTDKLLDSLKN